MATHSLRRRIFGSSGNSEPASRESSPTPEPTIQPGGGDNLRVLPATTLHALKRTASHKSHTQKPHGLKRRNLWIFGLGGLFGVALAAFFAGSNDMIDLAGLAADLNIDAVWEALPAGLIKDAKDIQVSLIDCHVISGFAPRQPVPLVLDTRFNEPL